MRAVIRAAEGFDRCAFTVSEDLRVQEAGIISEDENSELIEGEIVPMQAKSHAHELLKSALAYKLIPVLPETLCFGVEFKAAPCARHKFQEYRGGDAAARRAFPFAGPRSKSWRRRVERGPDEVLTHPALPGFSIRLSDY